MKIGIGLDIEEIERFRKAIHNKRFMKLTFTQEEIRFWESKHRNLSSLAGIFASKEASVKAMTGLLKKNFSILDFEVIHDKFGVPQIRFRKKNMETELPKTLDIALSISHTKETVIAFALARTSR